MFSAMFARALSMKLIVRRAAGIGVYRSPPSPTQYVWIFNGSDGDPECQLSILGRTGAGPGPCRLLRCGARSAADSLTVGRAVRLPPNRRGTHSRQDFEGREFESDRRPHHYAGQSRGKICWPALLRPFGSIPVALDTPSRRVGVPPTCNMHVTDTLPHE